MSAGRCHRCGRPATHALAVEGAVLRLCARHAAELAERLQVDPWVRLGRRRVRLDAPELACEGAGR